MILLFTYLTCCPGDDKHQTFPFETKTGGWQDQRKETNVPHEILEENLAHPITCNTYLFTYLRCADLIKGDKEESLNETSEKDILGECNACYRDQSHLR